MRRLIGIALVFAVVLVVVATLASRGVFGVRQKGGRVTEVRHDAVHVGAREQGRQAAARVLGAGDRGQILFGDLHVHTTFSFDAYAVSLPMVQGEGSHPPADACDFARFCADLDFWSINDHAEGLTPYQWSETKESVRQCNAVAGDPASPDLVTYLGWEWTQIGATPEDHYGHKNVVLLDTAEDEVPARPIASRRELFPGGTNAYGAFLRLGLIAAAPGERGRQPYLDFARFLQDRDDLVPCAADTPVRELPSDCLESASTPTELFGRLDDWGFPNLVIPHGNTWGIYTPPGSSWDEQLAAHEDPEADEFLIEVFSGHGSIEEYRDWRAVRSDESGKLVCPAPSPGFTPACWRAGEIIHERCIAAGETTAECEVRAEEARAHHVAAGTAGHLTVPGSKVDDWRDAGQCADCFMPAFDYRPGGSVQYALALRDLTDRERPKRFRFGFIGSSDVHTARPGTGYKETMRRRMTDAALGALGPPAALTAADPVPRSRSIEDVAIAMPFFERFASFFGTGGLVAVHSEGRDRNAIWDALHRKQVYGTSGDRILLWFDLLPEARGDGVTLPMGSSVARAATPRFEVRAAGAFEQKPGCPPDTLAALPAERMQALCGGECHHPSDRRKRIDRIEVVRIRPRSDVSEPVASLIEDPWQVLPCPPGTQGCRVSFEDPDFAPAQRDTLYYVRAIEEASPAVNGANLRCQRDERGRCLEVSPCRATEPTAYDDDCLSSIEERAWSSPIFVDYDPSA